MRCRERPRSARDENSRTTPIARPRRSTRHLTPLRGRAVRRGNPAALVTNAAGVSRPPPELVVGVGSRKARIPNTAQRVRLLRATAPRGLLSAARVSSDTWRPGNDLQSML
jgi:hypothetical protein